MTQRCRPRLSPRGIADKMRRESEHRQDARDAQAARTTHRTDATGRAVHMVGWSSEQLAKWDAEQAEARVQMRVKASWERCPVCTTQCTQNECKDGCAIEKENTKVTSPPKMPSANFYRWSALFVVIFIGVALLLTKPWRDKEIPPLTDAQAIKICEGYTPVGDKDRARVLRMYAVCNQALESIKRDARK